MYINNFTQFIVSKIFLIIETLKIHLNIKNYLFFFKFHVDYLSICYHTYLINDLFLQFIWIDNVDFF